MAKEFLDDAEVGAGVEHVGCEAVAQGVGGDVAASGQGLGGVFVDDALDAAGRQRPAAVVDEEAVVIWAAEFMAGAEIVVDGVGGGLAEVGDTLFFPFAEEAEGAPGEVDVADAEAGEFAGTGAAAVKRFEDRAVAETQRIGEVGGFEQGSDLGNGEDIGQVAGETRGLDVLCGVLGEFADADIEFVGGADLGEFTCGGPRRPACGLDVAQEGAHVVAFGAAEQVHRRGERGRAARATIFRATGPVKGAWPVGEVGAELVEVAQAG